MTAPAPVDPAAGATRDLIARMAWLQLQRGSRCRILLDVTAQRAIQVSGRVIVLGGGSVEI